MKAKMRVLSLFCLLGFLTGCGVNEQKHKEVVSQLADAKQELDGINSQVDTASQQQSDLEVKIESGKRKIATLQSQQNELKKQGADLDVKIAKLQSQNEDS